MVFYISSTLITIVLVAFIIVSIKMIKIESKAINDAIETELKDWSSLQCWNYMQDHKNDKFVIESDRIRFLACKKIIDKRMR